MMKRTFAAAFVAAFLCMPAYAQFTPPPSGASGTIAAGGSAQNILSGAEIARGWEVCNPDATNDLWVSDMGTAAPNAAGSYRVPANGGCYLTPRDGKPTVLGPVSLYGSVTGQKFSARKW